jgi:hypothetical protein
LLQKYKCAPGLNQIFVSLVRSIQWSSAASLFVLLQIAQKILKWHPQHREIVETSGTERLNVCLNSWCNQSIWIPDFQHWGGYNDRAAYGSPRVMSSYMIHFQHAHFWSMGRGGVR